MFYILCVVLIEECGKSVCWYKSRRLHSSSLRGSSDVLHWASARVTCPTPVEGNCEITAIFNYARAASNTTAVQSSSLCSNGAKHVLVVKTRSKSEIEVIDREQIVEVFVPLTSEELGSHASGSSRQQKSLLTFKVSVDTDKFPEKWFHFNVLYCF